MRLFIGLKSFTLLTLTLILAGCSHTIPASERPSPPAQLGKTPPTIAPLNAAGKQAQAPESVLPVALTVDLTPVQRTIQGAIPERFTEEGHPLASDYRWKFSREGEPQVLIQDGLVKYQALYRGEIESMAARACRLDPLFPMIEGTGRLVLREQDQGLLVTMSESRTTINLKPESDTKCNMFNVDIQNELAELFGQEKLTQQIEKSLETAGHTIPIQLVWDRLQEPITVGQSDSRLCLYGKGRDFTVGSFNGPTQQTTITAIARQTPVALYQTPCQKPATSPLKVYMDNKAVVVQGGQPYKVLLSVPVPYAVLNQQLQEKLFHQEAKLPSTFGNILTIERAVASDVNGWSLLTVQTSGAVDGTLYYWGTPRLEHDGNIITMPDLQMANETKMALDKVNPGYWQTIDEQLKPRLRQAAVVDLSQRIGNMKRALSGQHKTGGLAVDLSMGRQEPGQVLSTRDALVADVLLEGTASATGRIPVTRQDQRDMIEKTELMDTPVKNTPGKAAGIPRPSERFSGHR